MKGAPLGGASSTRPTGFVPDAPPSRDPSRTARWANIRQRSGPRFVDVANAITVHKAQGSEYPAVVIPVTTQHYPMLQRNLLYTGVTRGRRLVVLVAQPKAVAIAVKGQHERRRWSKLREWLVVNGGSGEETG